MHYNRLVAYFACTIFCVTSLVGCTTSEVEISTTETSTTVDSIITTGTTTNTATTISSTTTSAVPIQLEVDQELLISGAVDKELSDELAFVLNDYGKNISIVCWSVDGSKVLEYNTKHSYFSACTVKMPVMYSYCMLADQGLLDINKELWTYQGHDYQRR